MEGGRRLITAHDAGLTAWAASSGACLPGLVLARPGSALSALPPHGPAVVQAAMLPVRPCLPTFARFPPPGPDWLHEIKHDGYRMLALRDGERVRLVSRYGVDWTHGFPAIVAAVEALAARNCLIDGEVIACGGDGLADFQLLRRRQHADPAILCAFDLLGLDGHDLRGEPIEERKAELARLLVDCRPALALNRVFDGPGPAVFEHACALGCEGIVSKRHGSRYATGRSRDWLTVKNPAALAVRPGQEGRRALGETSTLIFRPAGESRPDDYSVIHKGQRVGRIYRMHSTDRELWYWTEIGARAPNTGLADTLEAAETAFLRAWDAQR